MTASGSTRGNGSLISSSDEQVASMQVASQAKKKLTRKVGYLADLGFLQHLPRLNGVHAPQKFGNDWGPGGIRLIPTPDPTERARVLEVISQPASIRGSPWKRGTSGDNLTGGGE